MPRCRSCRATTSSAPCSCSSARQRSQAEATDFLHLAAVAPALTEVAVREAKEEVEQNLSAAPFLEDLRSGPDLERAREWCAARGTGWSCDLARGGRGAVRREDTDRPAPRRGHHREDAPPAPWRSHIETRAGLDALPAVGGRRRPETHPRPRRASWLEAPAPARHRRPLELLRRPGPSSAARSRRPSSCSTSCANPTRRSPQDIGTGTYRLLFRVLASHPEEGALVLRGHRGRRSSATTTSTAPTSSAPSEPTSTRTGSERDGGRRSTPTATPWPIAPERVKELTSLDPMLLRGPRAPGPRPQGVPDHRSAPAVGGAAAPPGLDHQHQRQDDDRQRGESEDARQQAASVLRCGVWPSSTCGRRRWQRSRPPRPASSPLRR